MGGGGELPVVASNSVTLSVVGSNFRSLSDVGKSQLVIKKCMLIITVCYKIYLVLRL